MSAYSPYCDQDPAVIKTDPHTMLSFYSARVLGTNGKAKATGALPITAE